MTDSQRKPRNPDHAQQGQERKRRVYRIATVTRFGRTSHQDFNDPERAFLTYEDKKKVINIVYVGLFRDGNLLLDDVKVYETTTEADAVVVESGEQAPRKPPKPRKPKKERASREQLETLRDTKSS